MKKSKKNDTSSQTTLVGETLGDKIFDIINFIFILIVTIIMLYPFWYIFVYALSKPELSASGGIMILPRGFDLTTYKTVLQNPNVWNGFKVSIIVTVIGTFLGTFLTATTAYPLSKTNLRGRGFFLFMIIFTMLFNGGMIPNYLLIKNLNLIDSLGALILPLLLSAYNIIIMRNFFESIPESLEESARIDGASDLRIFFQIIIPLSKAVIATIALFTAVMYWNDFFSTILYINAKEKWSLQAVLRDILSNTQEAMTRVGVNVRNTSSISATSVRNATIIIATVPIIMVYPFLQKYFAKGVMVGSVKG